MAPTTFFKTVLLVILLGLAGCASTPDPADVALTITTSSDLNPDPDGRPSPVVLQIYRLKDVDAFNNARFFELYDNGKQILGQDLVDVSEIELSPSVNRTVQVDGMTVETAYLGLLAAFRDIDSARWRVVFPTPLDSDVEAAVTLYGVELSYKLND